MIKLGINIILVCMTLILSTVKGYALSPCIGAYNAFTWTDCFGIDTHASGSIYRGDWLDGKYNGKVPKPIQVEKNILEIGKMVKNMAWECLSGLLVISMLVSSRMIR